MAIRKLSDLYFPEHYRLMLSDGRWYTYDTQMSCAVDRVDRRLALRMIEEGYVADKHVDFVGRIMYSIAPPIMPQPERGDSEKG
jgi:hypothetical protein